MSSENRRGFGGILLDIGPVHTVTLLFFPVYILFAVLFLDRLEQGNLDILIPAAALLGAFLLPKLRTRLLLKKIRAGTKSREELIKREKRLRSSLLHFVPLVIIYQNLSFFGTPNRIYDSEALLIDEIIFGRSPVFTMQSLYSDLLTETMSIFYLIYLFVPFVYFFVYIKGKERTYRELELTTIFMHYIALMFFIAFPVEGPKYHYSLDFTSELGGWSLTKFNEHIFKSVRSTAYDCFPSMHSGLFILVTYSMFRTDRRTLFFMLPITTLLITSTMYLRYHYAIDVIAAFPLVVICVLFSRFHLKLWERIKYSKSIEEYPV